MIVKCNVSFLEFRFSYFNNLYRLLNATTIVQYLWMCYYALPNIQNKTIINLMIICLRCYMFPAAPPDYFWKIQNNHDDRIDVMVPQKVSGW